MTLFEFYAAVWLDYDRHYSSCFSLENFIAFSMITRLKICLPKKYNKLLNSEISEYLKISDIRDLSFNRESFNNFVKVFEKNFAD